MLKKIVLAIGLIAITGSQMYPASAQSLNHGVYPIYNKEKLLVADGVFKDMSLRQASGSVTILVKGEEKVFITSKFLTIQKNLNKCFDSPKPEYHIDCKTWPEQIKANKTRVRLTYWVLTPPAMHEDGIVKDMRAI